MNKVSSMSNSIIPIGTIVPFGGDVKDRVVEQWLAKQGWIPCDGRSLDKRSSAYSTLYSYIGSNYGGNWSSFNLPDLRGTFARGVDNGAGNDPDSTDRIASKPGGNTGDQIVSAEACATQAPSANAFTTNTTGDHNHKVPHTPIGNNAYAIAGSHYGLWTTKHTTTSTEGQHTHTVTAGGDQETRPVNLYVNYIIRYK